jgi:hypothetical protein
VKDITASFFTYAMTRDNTLPKIKKPPKPSSPGGLNEACFITQNQTGLSVSRITPFGYLNLNKSEYHADSSSLTDIAILNSAVNTRNPVA